MLSQKRIDSRQNHKGVRNLLKRDFSEKDEFNHAGDTRRTGKAQFYSTSHGNMSSFPSFWLRATILFTVLGAVACFSGEKMRSLSTYVTGSIARDERVVFFPTLASQLNDTHWRVPIHGWIFQPEDDSKKRAAFVSLLGRAFNVNSIDQKEIFQRRVQAFIVDNRRMKRPFIEFIDNISTRRHMREKGKRRRMPFLHRMSPSQKNGHFRSTLILSNTELNCKTNTIINHTSIKPNGDKLNQKALPSSLEGNMTLASFRVIASEHDNRNFSGVVHLVTPTGISIISDIDDTIKITNVLDKKQFLKNTFVREFQAVPGMAQLYRQWKDRWHNCSFHYVSASTYQLYEELDAFSRSAGFPPATFHLKTIRPKDSSQTLNQLLLDPRNYKVAQIRRIFQEFPQRSFVLVGDSGEKDPEVYASLYHEYGPTRIKAIYIRNVNNATHSRMEGVPRNKWHYFDTGMDLLA